MLERSRRARVPYESPMTFRLYNPATNRFLHLSAKGETKGTDHAWLGYRYQAVKLIEQAAARGDDFPFEVVDA